jgi:hypothetical protein
MTRIFHTIRVLMFAAASPLLAAAPVTIEKPDSLVLEFAADARPKSLRPPLFPALVASLISELDSTLQAVVRQAF